MEISEHRQESFVRPKPQRATAKAKVYRFSVATMLNSFTFVSITEELWLTSTHKRQKMRQVWLVIAVVNFFLHAKTLVCLKTINFKNTTSRQNKKKKSWQLWERSFYTNLFSICLPYLKVCRPNLLLYMMVKYIFEHNVCTAKTCAICFDWKANIRKALN
jgi:hypothetical protein